MTEVLEVTINLNKNRDFENLSHRFLEQQKRFPETENLFSKSNLCMKIIALPFQNISSRQHLLQHQLP